MRPTLLGLLLLPSLAPAQALSPSTQTMDLSPSATASAPSATPSPTPDIREVQLIDALRWQPDPKHAALEVEAFQVGDQDPDCEVRLRVTDLTATTLTARRLYDASFPATVYLGSQALPASLREHDLLFALQGQADGQQHYVALTWSGGQVLEALNVFTKERPETLQGKDAQYLLFNLLDPDTFGTDIYRALPGKPYDCVLRCVPFAQRFESLNQYLRQQGTFIDGQSISPCGADHP